MQLRLPDCVKEVPKKLRVIGICLKEGIHQLLALGPGTTSSGFNCYKHGIDLGEQGWIVASQDPPVLGLVIGLK